MNKKYKKASHIVIILSFVAEIFLDGTRPKISYSNIILVQRFFSTEILLFGYLEREHVHARGVNSQLLGYNRVVLV